MKILLFCLLLSTGIDCLIAQQQLFLCEDGHVFFRSDAPLELIEANSKQLRGVIDPQKRSFAFRLSINSFEGFNSRLQQVHFNENYLESHTYPNAIFKGKIIEHIDFTKEGTYDIRAKGILEIHGIKQERIIKSKLKIQNEQVSIQSFFSILLEEHDIRIPKIVHQKISELIYVQINAILKKQNL